MRNRVKDLLDSIMYEHLLPVVKFYHNSCVLPCMVKVLDTLACISHFAKKIASYLYENNPMKCHPMTFCQIAFSLYISSKTCDLEVIFLFFLYLQILTIEKDFVLVAVLLWEVENLWEYLYNVKILILK